MNYLDNDDDMNLDDAMFLDRMGHLAVQADEKIQALIDTMAQELFDANRDDLHLTRIQVLNIPEEKALKQVMVDDSLYAHIVTHIDLTGDFPQILVELKKVPPSIEATEMKSQKNSLFGFMQGKASA